MCCACKPGYKQSVEQLNFKQFTPGSAHEMTILTHDEYLATATHVSPWAQLSGWHLLNNYRDLMHVLFLGTCKDLLASNVKLLAVYNLLPGNPQEALDKRLRAFSEDMYHECKSAHLALRRRALTRANLSMDKSQFVELGSVFKAAQIKCMVYFFTKRMLAVAGSIPHGELVAMCNWTLLRAINIFDSSGLLLTPADAAEASRCLDNHLMSWQVLSHRFAEHRCYFLRPKHHGLAHLAQSIKRNRLNPRSYQCYDEESFIGRVKRFCSKCHGRTASLRSIQRYLLLLGFRFQDSRST